MYVTMRPWAYSYDAHLSIYTLESHYDETLLDGPRAFS